MFLWFILFTTTTSASITVIGPLVDKYCWNTLGGTALDTGANLKVDPFQHTIHCLLFRDCLSSGFIIVEKLPGASQYSIKYELSDPSALIAAELRRIAPSGSARYSARSGFMIAATGTDMGNGVLSVTQVAEFTGNTSSPTTGTPTMSLAPTITRAPSAAPTVSPPACNTALVSLQFGVSVKSSVNGSHAFLIAQTSNAPNWFAVGFGAGMVNSNAIVFEDGMPVKRYLLAGQTKADFQEQTPTGFTVLSDITTGSARKVCLQFSLPAPSGINLGQSASTAIVYARGSTPVLNYHQDMRGRATLTVVGLSGAKKNACVGVLLGSLAMFSFWF